MCRVHSGSLTIFHCPQTLVVGLNFYPAQVSVNRDLPLPTIDVTKYIHRVLSPWSGALSKEIHCAAATGTWILPTLCTFSAAHTTTREKKDPLFLACG